MLWLDQKDPSILGKASVEMWGWEAGVSVLGSEFQTFATVTEWLKMPRYCDAGFEYNEVPID